MADILATLTLGQYHLMAIPAPDGTTVVTNDDRVLRVWGVQVAETGGWVEADAAPGSDAWTEQSTPGGFSI